MTIAAPTSPEPTLYSAVVVAVTSTFLITITRMNAPVIIPASATGDGSNAEKCNNEE